MAKRRRGSGEGAIYFRTSDQRWVGSLDLGMVGTKRLRKVVYGPTRKAVAEKMTRLLNDKQSGSVIAVERQTLEAFATQWLDQVVKPTTRPNTYTTYARMLRLHILPTLGAKQLVKITTQDVQRLLSAKRAELAPRSLLDLRNILGAVLQQAVVWRLIPSNVAVLAVPPKREDVPPTFLSPEDARTFLQAAIDDRFAVLYRVALFLGLRRGEVLGLRWQDIDFERGTLRVEVQMQYYAGRLPQLVPPKSKRSRRLLPLPTSLATALRTQHTQQLQERLAAGGDWQEQGLVFTTPHGLPVAPETLRSAFQRVLAQAGLPSIPFHALRHSCASLLAAQHVPSHVAMAILGHSTLAMTLHYTHAIEQSLREGADALEVLLLEVS